MLERVVAKTGKVQCTSMEILTQTAIPTTCQKIIDSF